MWNVCVFNITGGGGGLQAADKGTSPLFLLGEAPTYKTFWFKKKQGKNLCILSCFCLYLV